MLIDIYAGPMPAFDQAGRCIYRFTPASPGAEPVARVDVPDHLARIHYPGPQLDLVVGGAIRAFNAQTLMRAACAGLFDLAVVRAG